MPGLAEQESWGDEVGEDSWVEEASSPRDDLWEKGPGEAKY